MPSNYTITATACCKSCMSLLITQTTVSQAKSISPMSNKVTTILGALWLVMMCFGVSTSTGAADTKIFYQDEHLSQASWLSVLIIIVTWPWRTVTNRHNVNDLCKLHNSLLIYQGIEGQPDRSWLLEAVRVFLTHPQEAGTLHLSNNSV